MTGLYDYTSVIKKPMDLGTVKKNISSGKYKTVHEAADDVRLVWTNVSETKLFTYISIP